MGMSALPLGRLLLFVVLNFVDFAETWVLIRLGGGTVYEGNPIAEAWLSNYGWQGLLVFKGLAALMVTAATVLICKHRPRLGRGVLTVACLILLGVTWYSGRLLAETTNWLAAL